jgi:thymidine phosphorylase
MPTPETARALARSLLDTGRRLGVNMTALITGMDQPLGCAVGNALEVVETIATLQGRGPVDLLEVTLALGERMLLLAGVAHTTTEAGALLARQLESGAAWQKFLDMVRLQGGDVASLEHPDRLPRARLQEPLPAPASGFVNRADAERIGRACAVLGAGRAQVADAVDHAVGVAGLAKLGAAVERGQPLAVLHANDERKLAAARVLLSAAFDIAPTPVTPLPLIREEVYA